MPGFDETTGLTLVAATCAALALFTAFGTLRALRRRKPIRASALGLGMGGLLMAAALLGSIALNLQTYHRFTLEQDVAQLRFVSLAPQLFEVRMQFPDGTSHRAELAGDEWQLDARVLKWSGFATVLGFDPLYRLERLSGRYVSAEQELTAPRTVENFTTDRGLDVWLTARGSDDWIPWVDAVYGSAAYLPMR
ncbi:MAG: cation/multidrug efflux pump, partial [Gammaproteobacteria bacterium]|nr:cation/multidrug efflux pump [Gammaproteobacteria bacterium]